MGFVPNANLATIAPEKLTAYLLAPDHPEGGPKAAVFLGHGFTADTLGRALRHHLASHPATSLSNKYGVKYAVDGPIAAPDGSQLQLRGVWIIHHGE